MISRWPERKSQVDPELREYWNIKGEISVCDDLLLRQNRLIVPSSLREEMQQVKFAAAIKASQTANVEPEISCIGQE